MLQWSLSLIIFSCRYQDLVSFCSCSGDWLLHLTDIYFWKKHFHEMWDVRPGPKELTNDVGAPRIWHLEIIGHGQWIVHASQFIFFQMTILVFPWKLSKGVVLAVMYKVYLASESSHWLKQCSKEQEHGFESLTIQTHFHLWSQHGSWPFELVMWYYGAMQLNWPWLC